MALHLEIVVWNAKARPLIMAKLKELDLYIMLISEIHYTRRSNLRMKIT